MNLQQYKAWLAVREAYSDKKTVKDVYGAHIPAPPSSPRPEGSAEAIERIKAVKMMKRKEAYAANHPK